MKIGSVVSIKDGLIGAANEALSYGANTFMTYTGAPQNTVRKKLSELKISEGLEFISKHQISDYIIHAPYIVNLATFKDDLFHMTIRFLRQEVERTIAMGAKFFVIHPGAYTEKDLNYGIARIAEGLNKIIDPNDPIFYCMETMSGKGTEVGKKFVELARIIDQVKLNEKVAVCFDTCHTHDSGYDIVNQFDEVLHEFDSEVGMEKLKVIHINGSKNFMGAHKDRHANIGAPDDHIGLKAIRYIAHHKLTQDIPLILETPAVDGVTIYKEEIEAIKNEK